MWAGSRANYGVRYGKYYFKVSVVENLPVQFKDSDGLTTKHVARMGVSVIDSDVGQLGETHMSFGFGGTAKKCTDKIFEDYGHPYGIGDEVVCLVDM